MAKILYRVEEGLTGRTWLVVAKSEKKAIKQVCAEYEVDDEDDLDVSSYEEVVEISSMLKFD